MDLATHLVLAERLLEACGLPGGGAVYAVLPEMDVKPAHYHRQFANILLYQPTIIDAAIEILRRPEAATRDFAALRAALAPALADLTAEVARLRVDGTAEKAALAHLEAAAGRASAGGPNVAPTKCGYWSCDGFRAGPNDEHHEARGRRRPEAYARVRTRGIREGH
jgi:hypothetical protein